MKKLWFVLIFLLLTGTVSAETLVLKLNKAEYTVGESAIITGYVLNDDSTGINNTNVTLYLDGSLENITLTDSEGYYSHYITNLTQGNYTLNASTSSLQRILLFNVFSTAQSSEYKIIASSLNIPYQNPILNFTVQKYTGGDLTTDPYNYSIYYPNGTQYNTTKQSISDNLTSVTLPSQIGTYTIIIDRKKTFTASVSQFNLIFDITDKAGNPKHAFKPNGIAYFQVEGYSNGQKIRNATVTAIVTDPTGVKKTVIFTEKTVGVYTGQSNITKTTPIQLSSGNYEIEFITKDSSNNEQKVKGFFSILGLSVEVDLVNKKPCVEGELIEFDIIIKNLEDGTLIEHEDIIYTLELEKDGKLYDASAVTKNASSDSTITSEFSYIIPEDFEDGGYFLNVKAVSSGKIGKGKEYFEVMNNQVFIELTDNFGGIRDVFKPGELARATVNADVNISLIIVEVYNKEGVLQSSHNSTTNSYVSFNVPQTQAEYRVEVEVTTDEGDIINHQRWISVQNYFSFLDVRNLNNEHQFIFTSGEQFLGEINVFDIATGTGVDISSFTLKFDKIIDEETRVEYTNVQSTKNDSYSDETSGRVTYNIIPPELPNGFFRIDYTLINTKGDSFKGKGWFGISPFEVDVKTYDSSGREKMVFSAGASINVTITLSESYNGTATIHREFFNPVTFNVSGGVGSTLLTSTDLPSQSGFYGFGVEIETDDGQSGFGDGFFEIKNLNFRSINVRNNGEYVNGQDIIADVTVEKSGSLVNNTNVTLARLTKAWDGSEVSASSVASLTSNLGRTTITITPSENLEPGDYFAELKGQKDDNIVYGGFGFRIVEDTIRITLSDTDKIFSTTENIEITITVTNQTGDGENNVTVNLTGLLNFNTWAPVSTTKSTTTSTNGVATITISAANFNAGRYAPIVSVEGMSKETVGFGEGEFEIRSLTATADFQDNSSFNLNEEILIDIDVIGDATVTAAVTDIYGTSQEIDYYYTNGLLTINNELEPKDYFVNVMITQGSNTITETLWFEIVVPWAYIHPLETPMMGPDDDLNFTYTIFTTGAGGWNLASATLILESIENMWTGEDVAGFTPINISTSNEDEYGFSLSGYNLSKGDYLLNFELDQNPDYSESLYFRIDNSVMIMIDPQVDGNNVTFIINTTGMSSPTYTLEGYENFENFQYVSDGSQVASGENTNFTLSNLDNGFYRVTIIINDSNDNYYWDVFFDIRVKDVEITGPEQGVVNEEVQFNISGESDNTFWIINPFTQIVLKKQEITADTTNITFTFNYPGFFIYSYGNDKWQAFSNAQGPNGSQGIDIIQPEFDVTWPWDDNMYQLNGDKNLTFNVTSGLSNTNLTLKITNHFDWSVTTISNLKTHETPETLKMFTFDLQDLNLTNGHHNVELTLQDGSDQPPREYFFIDIFPDQYDMWAWTNNWEYRAGDNVTVNIEVYDILNHRMRIDDIDSVTLDRLDDPFGSDKSGSTTLTHGIGNMTVSFDTNNFVTGNYHGELLIEENESSRHVPFDFFVRGNDNLELYWYQYDQWEYSSTDTFRLRVTVKDNGAAAVGVGPATLVALEKWSDNWDQEPENVLSNVSGAYNFSNSNLTDSNGRLYFDLNISQANLSEGSYGGRLNIGGQQVWFDFSIRNYMVDAYTDSWEYGLSDTIEVKVKARNIQNWNPIIDNGNVTITKIMKHEPGYWQPENVSLAAFNLDNAVFDVTSGEALIEMQVNTSLLNLTQPYEFELQLEMNLGANGQSQGGAWFRLSNTEKPGITIIDRTGSEPESYFEGQTYTLQVTNVESAMLRELWGPCGKSYHQNLVNNSGTFELNFTTPYCSGWFTMEVEVDRGNGPLEHIYTDFQIGSGTELQAWGEGNVVPSVNFTVYVTLFGEGVDPWCEADPNCTPGDWVWFGPLANKTVTLKGMKDLESFTYIDLSNQNISAITAGFEVFMFTSEEEGGESYNCTQHDGDEPTCNTHSSDGCYWVPGPDICEGSEESSGSSGGGGMGPGEDDEMLGPGYFPGDAIFNIDPDSLNMTAGEKYSLIFSYIDDEGEETTQNVVVQVEEFHVSVSRRTEDVGANSEQQVWVKTTDLYGVPKPNCSINFTAIYSGKDWQLAKTLTTHNKSDVNGELVFTYTAPSLPGDYMVIGETTCDLNGTEVTQEVDFYIDVGAKNLDVDMKTKFKEGENIKISITTKDRLGNPESQRLELNLFHDRDDYPHPIYSLGGSDCTVLDANQDWDHSSFDGGGDMINNRIEVETDSQGNYEVELCPLPNGMYMMDVFPMYQFEEMDEGPIMGGPKDDFGFFTDFIVSSADISISTDSLNYQVGDTITINLSAYDENGDAIEGQIVAADSIIEEMTVGKELGLWELEETINLTNGTVQLNVHINGAAPWEYNESIDYNVTAGPADIYLMIQDNDGDTHIFESMLGAVVRSSSTSITIPDSIKTNRLIDVDVQTDNLSRYKVQTGIFFLQDNAEKEKMWMIENGVFLENNYNGTSSSHFQILSPREPGDYYLGMLIFPLSHSAMGMSGATEVLIAPISVNLDLINVTGRVTEDDGSTAMEGALVMIGKVEAYTDINGSFSMQVPKGKYVVEIENKLSSTNRQFMKTDQHNFDENAEINVSFYGIRLSGDLEKLSYNISSPSVNLELLDYKVRINVSINNTGEENLTDFEIKAIGINGEETKSGNVSAGTKTSSFFKTLYAGFETNTYTLTIKMKDSNWSGSSYIKINGNEINSTVGAYMKKNYDVWTYVVAGDGMDNDGDCAGFTPVPGCEPHESYYGQCEDEEIDNNKDDDCDGKVDEDLEGEEYFEWCGNGFCSFEEANSGNCFEDCGNGEYCGDGNCTGDENTWCFEDCNDTVEYCDTPNECLPDGSPNFCNGMNIVEYANWCQSNCGPDDCWACDAQGTPGSTECEAVGCTLGTDDYGEWCYKEDVCNDDTCWACHSEGECTNTSITSICEWEVDPYNPDGGWCNRPWECSSECGACYDSTSCSESNATIENGTVSCIWKEDYQGCEWNMSWGPPGGGGVGIIDNIWLGETNTTEDYNSTIDWMCWSGNCGANVPAGEYYLIIDVGDTMVNVSINGTEFEVIDNTGVGYWRQIPTSSTFNFTNGTWEIEVIDLIGPDYIAWTVEIGGSGGSGSEPESELLIVGTDINEQGSVINFTFTLDNLSGMNFCDGDFVEANELVYYSVGIDSNQSGGCSGGDCWSTEDYVVYLEANETGGYCGGFEFWNGTDLDEGAASVGTKVDCSQNKVFVWVETADVDISDCEDITVRFDTSIENTITEDEELINWSFDIDYQAGGDCGSSASFDLTKTCENCPVNIGEIVIFGLTVVNNGSANLTDYTLIDDYNITFLNYSGSDQAPDFINCTLGEVEWDFNLTTGDNLTRYVNFTAIAAGNAENIAEVDNGTIALSHSLAFSINNGGEPEAMVEILSPQDMEFFNISNNITLDYNISGDLTNYNHTNLGLYLGGNVTNWVEKTDLGEGVFNYTWNNVSDGFHILFVQLKRLDDSVIMGDNVSIMINITGG